MRTTLRVLAVAAIAATALAVIEPSASAAPSANGSAHRATRVCAATAGAAACHAYLRTDLAPAATPSGFGPADLRSAYKLTTSGSASQTVAIVDAYDDPTAEADLAAYRTQFGLPACTTANGCFSKVDQNGGTNYPRKNAGWAQEISLDLDMVSAICPNCHILLVEAKTQLVRQPRRGGEPGGDHGRHRHQQQLGRIGRVRRDLRLVLQPPRHRHHGELGRQRLRRGVPGLVALRDRGRRHPPDLGRRHPRLDRDRVVRRRLRLLDPQHRADRPGVGRHRLRQAGRSPTSRRSPTRTPASQFATTAAGWSSAARASPRRSSPASTAWPATPQASTTTTRTRTHPRCSTSRPAATASCPTSQWCTARAGWDGPTGLGTPNGTGAF